VTYLSTLCTAGAAALSAATAAAVAAVVPALRGFAEPLVLTAVLVALSTGWAAQAAPRAVRAGRAWVPAVAVVAAGLDVLLAGPLGALGVVAFVLASAVAAGLRRAGGRPAAVAVLAAGPLAAVLAAPLTGLAPSLPAALVAVPALAAVVVAAVACVVGLRALVRRWLPLATPAPRREPGRPADVARAAGATGLGLAAAFAVAGPLFPAHASWVPLTAFVVGAGPATWNDSVRKGVLRLAGATAGALVGTLALLVAGPPVPVLLGALALLAGTALRATGYAWWAAGLTAALVLVAAGPAGPDPAFGLARVGAVLVGGGLAIAAALVLLPAARPAAPG
jgi:hypothetical protein